MARRRRAAPAVAALSVLALATSSAFAARPGDRDRAPAHEPVRVLAAGDPVVRGTSEDLGTLGPPTPAARRAQRAMAGALGPQGVVDVDERTGTPRLVARLDGFLTGPRPVAPAHVALGYLRRHLAAFGMTPTDLDRLHLVRDYVDILGTHHLVWEQRRHGIAAWGADVRAHVTADGRLVEIGGSPLPELPAASAPRLSARDAIAAAARGLGVRAPTLGRRSRSSGGRQRRTAFGAGDDARLVFFGTGRGPRLAWRSTARIGSGVFVSVVDARTGDVLWQANLEKQDAGTGQAWEYYPSTTVPAGGGVPHTVSFPVEDARALSGATAWVWPDVDDDDRPDRQIRATSGLDWSYPATLETADTTNACTPAFPCSWQTGVPFSWRPHVEANAVQVYHFLTVFHDHLLAAPIGFTEAAGNFQVRNHTGHGEGHDPVVANVMDGADTRRARPGLPDANHAANANMFTPPDGHPPLMQMYLFPAIPAAGIPATNGGDDGSVVYHEYTHGLSNRLVTFADGTGALNSAQAGAMGEAWSDFYAMDFLVSQGFVPDTGSADVVLGRYVGGGRSDAVRFEPIDCTVGASAAVCAGGLDTGPGGFTYGDFGHVFREPEVHSDGEIWGQTLWDLRAAFGSDTTLALVTRGMELSPPEPSFLDMRNAILQADLVAFDGEHIDQLWQVFARRGMGFFASTVDGDDVTPVADFTAPPACPEACGRVRGRVVDAQTGDPVRAIDVAIAGHAPAFLGDLADRTNGSGAFSIPRVPFHDYVVTVRGDEHEPVAIPVTVDGNETVRIDVIRDWASLGGGARLVHFTGPNYSPGCGPAGAWDASLDTGWGSDAVHATAGSSPTGPRVAIVKLPRAVDVSAFGFATGGACGDGPDAAVKRFEIQTRTRDGAWRTAIERSRSLSLGEMHTLRPRRGTTGNVRYVKLIMLGNRGDPRFMDVLELSVRGVPASGGT